MRSASRFSISTSIWSVVILLVTTFVAHAQTGTLSGIVVDAKTSKPLPFASVYVNRTTIGAEADGDGKFTLQKLPAGKVEIICSFVGYEASKIELQFTEGGQKDITIKLSRLANELEAVTVTAKKDNQWKKDYASFQKAFLGKDDFAEQCEIVNAGVLEFKKAKNNVLTATASQPLEVVNPALGYRIIYDLSRFEYSPKQYSIQGNIRFEVMKSDDPTLIKRWGENRNAAYTKSLRYFFKSTFDNRLDENGFTAYVEKIANQNLSRASLFSYARSILDPFLPGKYLKKTSDASFFVLTLPGRMEIHDRAHPRAGIYRDMNASVSWIETTEPVIISRTGIVQNQSSLQLIGYMSEPRVAQLLPEDYSPENMKVIEPVVAASKVLLTEKIYVHTDKDYYYPGDVIWFKGYIQYSDPSQADSLSRVAYVELIDSTKKVVLRKALPVEYGTFTGEMELPVESGNGNYLLRSYTEYMRNFSEASFFLKPIPVLDAYQRINDVAGVPEKSQQYTLTIEPSKSAFKKREDVQLTIAVRDEEGAYIPTDLSVSVVNGELFKSLPEKNPLTQFFRDETSAMSKKEDKYIIEKGITLRGKFSTGKHLSEPVKITAVLGKFDDINTLTTDLDGNFFLTGFQFNDSSNIALQALNKKGKPYGTFELSKPDLPAVTIFPTHQLSVIKSTHPVPKISDFEAKAIQLKEVTVTAKKEQRGGIYDGGGFKIDRDFIKATNYPDIITLMQARMPVRISYAVDGNGFVREVVRVFGKDSPLLVVDGVAYSESDQDIARAIRLISIREVQSIEILRGPSAAIFGTRGMNGAILITTRVGSGNYEDIGFNVPDKTFTYFPFFGYSSVKTFKYPDYNTKSKDDRPDYRTTLYWNPTVWLNGTEPEHITFSAGDIGSSYRIVVKGVTVTGEPISGQAVITIE